MKPMTIASSCKGTRLLDGCFKVWPRTGTALDWRRLRAFLQATAARRLCARCLQCRAGDGKSGLDAQARALCRPASRQARALKVVAVSVSTASIFTSPVTFRQLSGVSNPAISTRVHRAPILSTAWSVAGKNSRPTRDASRSPSPVVQHLRFIPVINARTPLVTTKRH
jgi:hypothetical protein